MRHGKKNNHLSRTDSHRRAMLSNMASSLIVHKRINTTVAKAKALRIYVEPLLTKSKTDSTHNRRIVFSYLQDKDSVSILFRDVATKIADRPGGYTRIIKTGNRLGDNAEMCFIELVDYNTIYNAKSEVKKAKTTRRGRSGSATAGKAAGAAPAGTTDVHFTEVKSTAKTEATAATEVEPVTQTEAPHAPAEPAASTPHADEPAEGKDDSADSASEENAK